MPLKTTLIAEKIMPPVIAGKMPSTVNDGKSQEVVNNANAFTKKPVTKTAMKPNGLAINNIKGRINRLTKPNKKAAAMASTKTESVLVGSNEIPGKMADVINSETPSTNQRTRKRITAFEKWESVLITVKSLFIEMTRFVRNYTRHCAG